MMKDQLCAISAKYSPILTLGFLFCFFNYPAFGVTVTVPGTSDPWLAGMPDGSTASGGDIAPDQSPVEVLGLSLLSGTRLRFSASGGVANAPTIPLVRPDGFLDSIETHVHGAENVMDEDEPRTYKNIDKILEVFPKRNGRFIKIRKVI